MFYGNLKEFRAAREAVSPKGTYEPHLTASLQKIEDLLRFVVMQFVQAAIYRYLWKG